MANEKILWNVNACRSRHASIKQIESSLPASNKYVIDESSEDSDYKASEFNYILEKSSGFIIFNTLYNTLVRLTKREF